MLQFIEVFLNTSYCAVLHALPHLISIAIYETAQKLIILIICVLLMRKARLGEVK